MRIGLSTALGVVAVTALWAGVAAWRWSHADFAALFRQRIVAELPAGQTAVFSADPGSIITGTPQPGARFVCGNIGVSRDSGVPVAATYSLYVMRGLFGWSINDGYTPATRPENQAVSDEQCAQLRAHEATVKKEG